MQWLLALIVSVRGKGRKEGCTDKGKLDEGSLQGIEPLKINTLDDYQCAFT